MDKIDIKAIRAELGIKSQSELARLLGVDQSTVCGWEKHGRRPSGAALKLIERMRAERREQVA